MELLGIPANLLAAMAAIYTSVQIRKVWLDCRKTELDCRKTKLEIDRLHTESQSALAAVPTSGRDTAPTSVTRLMPLRLTPLFTRWDAIVFAPGFVWYLILFECSASKADVTIAVRGMLVSATCAICQFGLFILLVGLRSGVQELNAISHMLLSMHTSQCEMLVETVKRVFSWTSGVPAPQSANNIGEDAVTSKPEHDAST